MITTKVETFFDSIRDKDIESYNNYWAELKPQNEVAAIKRYLFAFMSVHTTWKNNCKGYNAIKQFNKWTLEKGEQLQLWNYDSDALFKRIEETRVGMQNNRTNYIGLFNDTFWDSPSDFIARDSGEGWSEWRDRLAKKILGLGKAKTSFAIEMLYPIEAKVVCMDTHLFQAYGLDQSKDARRYKEIEDYWLGMCAMWNVPSTIARAILWDRKQDKTDSRYWTYVLED